MTITLHVVRVRNVLIPTCLVIGILNLNCIDQRDKSMNIVHVSSTTLADADSLTYAK